MKERFVDFALLIALGIIGLAIVFTLVNLGRDRTPSGATAPAPTQTAQTDVPTEPAGAASPEGAPSETGLEAVTPAEAAEPNAEPADDATETEPAEVATPVEVIPALVDAAEGNADTGTADGLIEADAATGGVSGGEDEITTASTTASSPLPTGTEALSRIGFNFATGQEGACSIPLEPWQHVAVSRDLLAEYGCGAQVTVTLPEPINGREEVTAVIADTMGPDAQRTVNIYVASDEPAFDYGLLEGGSVKAAAAP